MRIAFGILLALTAVTASANPSGRLTVLVPINPGIVVGAGGTWTTTLWATNNGDTDATIDCSNAPCQVLKAHSTAAVAMPHPNLTHQGFFGGVLSGLIINPVGADQVSFSLRVTDSVSGPQSAGSDIPLPRPSAFHNATISLAHIPVNSHSRSRVRLYGMANGSATVRVIGVQSNQELFATTIPITGVDTNPGFPPAPDFPSYGEIALPDSYPGSDTAVRVEITPAGDLRIWGFASVTDNVSQQFLIVAPPEMEYVPVSLL